MDTAARTAELLDAALDYAKRGWAVMPCHHVRADGTCSCGKPDCTDIGKHPRIKEWPKNATTNPGQIMAWWGRWPKANVGILTGTRSGLLVLDVDGDEGRETLKTKGLHPPATVVARTGGGGNHHLYAHPGGAHKNTVGEIGDHVDTRGEQGLFIAPPSVNAKGPYSWVIPPDMAGLAEAPGWMLTTAPPEGERREAPPLPPIISDGRRNTLLTSLAGTLRRRNAAEAAILAACREENKACCAPPLSDDEVVVIVRGVCQRYEPAESGDVTRALTDLGNGERLVDAFGERLRYERASNGWYAWTGQRWERDEALTVEAYAAQTARGIYEEAAREIDPAKRMELAKHARASESRQKQQAMVSSARHMLAISPTQWDRDPWVLNVANGTIDLRTGELRPHRQEDLITMLAPVGYDPTGTAPTFEAFLEQVQPDPEIRDFLRLSLGYALTGAIRQQHFWFAIGVGANGKGTLLNLVLALLGDYAKSAPPDLFIRERGRHPTELAFLRGARLIVATETQEGARVDESKVKQLTGGDMVTARFIGGDFFTFAPTHKLWLQGNHKPKISGTDHAIWRRPLLVDFPVTIAREDQDPALPERLLAEAPGVLAWMVQGCLDWQKQGLRPPAAVLAATEAYRLEMDVIGEFLNERCVLEPAASERVSILHEAYAAWCEANGEKPASQRDFGRRLKERGHESIKSTGGYTHYLGIQLSGASGVSGATL